MKRRYFFICYESAGISQTNNAPGKIIGQLFVNRKQRWHSFAAIKRSFATGKPWFGLSMRSFGGSKRKEVWALIL